MPIVAYIKKDITETHHKVIMHGVNCQNVMGSGVAKALFDKWSSVKEKYHEYCEFFDVDARLGKINLVQEKDKLIVNAFTQYNFGYDKKKYVNYWAIANCFKSINKHLSFFPDCGIDLAIPKIGCGLAGGNWDIVKEIINDSTPDIEVYVYEI